MAAVKAKAKTAKKMAVGRGKARPVAKVVRPALLAAKALDKRAAEEPVVIQVGLPEEPVMVRRAESLVRAERRAALRGGEPVQVGVWGRLKRWWGGEQRVPVRDQMAAVKAGVLEQMEALGAQKGVAVSGGPFRNVVLPQLKAKPRRKAWMMPLVVGLALVLVVVMVLVGSRPQGPGLLVGEVLEAVAAGDVDEVQDKVDVDGVVSSVVSQILMVPHGDSVAAEVTNFLKPSLAEGLREDVLAAVKAGGVDENNQKSLLVKMWRDMGGASLRVGEPRVAVQDDKMAAVELPLVREDVALALPLQVIVVKQDRRWVVADVPNFGAVLEAMEKAGRTAAMAAQVEPAAGVAAHVAANTVKVRGVRKVKAAGDAAFIVSMTVENTGAQPLKDVPLQIAFGDAAGQPMKVVEVMLDGELMAGESREQSWTIPVDDSKPADRYVADLPLSALSVVVSVR